MAQAQRPKAYIKNTDIARARFFRVKEKLVMDSLEKWLERRFPTLIREYDKVTNRFVKYRTDLRIIVSERWEILLEVDEATSHSGHTRRLQDLQRYERINETMGDKMLYVVRFNPDEYYSEDGVKNASIVRLDAGRMVKNKKEFKRRMKYLKFELLKALNFFGERGPKQPVYRFLFFNQDTYHKRPETFQIDSDGTASLHSSDFDNGDGYDPNNPFDVVSDEPFVDSDVTLIDPLSGTEVDSDAQAAAPQPSSSSDNIFPSSGSDSDNDGGQPQPKPVKAKAVVPVRTYPGRRKQKTKAFQQRHR